MVQLNGHQNRSDLTTLQHPAQPNRDLGQFASSEENPSQPKTIKLCKAAFHTRLLDLHRSSPFGIHTAEAPQEYTIPEGWLSRDAQNESSLIYTRQRDIHDVGIVLLKMLLGLDVVDRFPDPITATVSVASSL